MILSIFTHVRQNGQRLTTSDSAYAKQLRRIRDAQYRRDAKELARLKAILAGGKSET